MAACQRSDVTSCGPLGAGPRCGMSPGCGRRWGMPGRAAREQCLWGWHSWWDSKKKERKKKRKKKTSTVDFWSCLLGFSSIQEKMKVQNKTGKQSVHLFIWCFVFVFVLIFSVTFDLLSRNLGHFWCSPNLEMATQKAAGLGLLGTNYWSAPTSRAMWCWCQIYTVEGSPRCVHAHSISNKKND